MSARGGIQATDQEIGRDADDRGDDAEVKEAFFRVHVRHAKHRGHECEGEEEDGDQGEQFDVVTLLNGYHRLVDGTTGLEHTGTAEKIITEAFDLLHLLRIHGRYILKTM